MATTRHPLSVLALGITLGLASWGDANPQTTSSQARPAPADKRAVTFRHEPNVLHIEIGGQPFADYVYADQEITRPHFAHVKTPAGIQVTRHRPPDPAKGDLMDHATMHPGIWMAFGDVSGNDYWRLKAKVEHEMFTSPPEGGPGKGHFAVRNYYLKSGSADRIASERNHR